MAEVEGARFRGMSAARRVLATSRTVPAAFSPAAPGIPFALACPDWPPLDNPGSREAWVDATWEPADKART